MYQRKTEFNAKCPFKVTSFGVSGKAIMDKVILSSNVGLICKGSDDVESMKEIHSFSTDSKYFTVRYSISAHICWSRVNRLYSKYVT